MTRHFIRATVCTILTLSLMNSAQARVWRVNNIPGINADFKELHTALDHAGIATGDTLHIEGSSESYGTAYLRKKLVLIGPGYFLDAATGNPGLQYNQKPATVQIIVSDSLASGSTFLGLSGKITMHPQADGLTISRCNVYLSDQSEKAGASAKNISITKSVISIYSAINYDNLYFANNIVIQYGYMPNALNSLVRNNIFTVQFTNVSSYIANNIFLNASLKLTNCTVKYNIATNAILPEGNNNKNNISATSLFAESSSSDAKYKLKAGSAAIAAGEPLNGVTPDAGIFGTDDPYRLSGIPPIPSIYSLAVPETVPATATKMSVTFSSRSNN